MPKFSVTAAFSVECYRDFEIEATDLEHALQELKRMDADDSLFQNYAPEYESADDHRIVEILDENRETVAEAIYIYSPEWKAI